MKLEAVKIIDPFEFWVHPKKELYFLQIEDSEHFALACRGTADIVFYDSKEDAIKDGWSIWEGVL